MQTVNKGDTAGGSLVMGGGGGGTAARTSRPAVMMAARAMYGLDVLSCESSKATNHPIFETGAAPQIGSKAQQQ